MIGRTVRYILLFISLIGSSHVVCGANKDTLLETGIRLYDQGEYDRSLEVLQQRLKLAVKEKDKRTEAIVCNVIGNNYTNTGKTVAALEAYQRSITASEAINDKKGIARTTKNIGALYSDTKDFDRALKKYDEAEQVALSVNDTLTFADCANNKGLIYEQQKKYPEALKEYDQALALYQALKSNERLALLYNNIGIVYKFLADYDKSIEYYQRSLAMSKSLDNKFLVAANQINIGNVYEMKGDFKKAIELNELGLQTGKEINAQEIIMEAYGNLAEDHAKSGDYQRGFDIYKTYTAFKDSFINLERSKQMAEMQTRYETEKKEKQIIALEKNRYQMLAVIGILVLLIAIAWLLYNQQQVRQQQAREKAVTDAEYKERMRIARDVHDDLGSGLSKISLLASVGQARTGSLFPAQELPQISEVAKELVDNMRDLIWVLNPENTTLDNLVTRLREYCGDYLDGMGVEATLEFSGDVPDMPISRAVQRNIFSTVKEALNNCMKHAAATTVAVTMKLDNRLLTITVADNGKGLDMAAVHGGGNGLQNMRHSIEGVGGDFTITARDGTIIQLAVPFDRLNPNLPIG